MLIILNFLASISMGVPVFPLARSRTVQNEGAPGTFSELSSIRHPAARKLRRHVYVSAQIVWHLVRE